MTTDDDRLVVLTRAENEHCNCGVYPRFDHAPTRADLRERIIEAVRASLNGLSPVHDTTNAILALLLPEDGAS